LAFATFNFLLATFIVSQTGLTFTGEASAELILAWFALFIYVKGLLILIPGYLGKIASMTKESYVPYMGTIALLVSLTLIYLDTRVF
jgi:uncharacterized membrane protein YidH (DUF202 family)